MIEKLKKIKLLAMDVDGTLTDGSMLFFGEKQIKVFNVYDGLGIRVAMCSGLDIVWVTGNVTNSVAQRARVIGVEEVYQGARDKSIAMAEIAENHKISLDEIAYIGDDLNDLPAYKSVGVGFAVANACDEVKACADLITIKKGGEGAVREAIETIFKAKGEWDNAIKLFLKLLEEEQISLAGPEAVA